MSDNQRDLDWAIDVPLPSGGFGIKYPTRVVERTGSKGAHIANSLALPGLTELVDEANNLRRAYEAKVAELAAGTARHSVGGQAEPSDAAKHTIAWTLDANRGCIEGRITCHAGPGDPCHRACRCEDASCYCGGATMEDIDFCNPLAFIENEDDVSLIERYDGADETLRDGPVELVWMPDGETYGWRYAAAAVSGEHQDAIESGGE